jgi:hypothetical protein
MENKAVSFIFYAMTKVESKSTPLREIIVEKRKKESVIE